MSRDDLIDWRYRAHRLDGCKGDYDMPADTARACVFDLWIVADTIEMTALFRRNPRQDELWLHSEGSPWLVIRGPRAGEAATACRRLFDFMARNQRDGTPRSLRKEGLISRLDYHAILARIRRGFEKNRAETRSRQSKIMKLAECLKLLPEPDATRIDFWHARCPGRCGHGLIIDAVNDRFYCGYCRKGGGPDELRQFVKSGRGTP